MNPALRMLSMFFACGSGNLPLLVPGIGRTGLQAQVKMRIRMNGWPSDLFTLCVSYAAWRLSPTKQTVNQYARRHTCPMIFLLHSERSFLFGCATVVLHGGHMTGLEIRVYSFSGAFVVHVSVYVSVLVE